MVSLIQEIQCINNSKSKIKIAYRKEGNRSFVNAKGTLEVREREEEERK